MSKRYDYGTLFCDSVRELLECVPHHWYSCLGVLRLNIFMCMEIKALLTIVIYNLQIINA